jgi:hypothetical protein
MKPVPPESQHSDESPGVPGFRTWREVYFFVFVCFMAVVVLLAIFSSYFS